ncbi:protein-tyrosine-phosphatase [Paucihalobacter ruber]|uniref:Protein-tyrosine-phosphatase n=1 Tax=Paucihalobacter ruber TaxID=2567861 RepID=A0A506PJ56_9FLAO|nr:protein-tyrosine-phosphatase [Paucihalobacter ruber]TPV33405.1 protein-tyrosine-phosphatase [Paucihalobacter ruber]
MYPQLTALIAGINLSDIPANRKSTLQLLIDYIQHKVINNQAVNLNFICTHNSRRSHLSQIWAQVMAANFEIPKVSCYSGGTEATAMFPMVGETLKAQGFNVMALSEGKNPVYAIKFSDHAHPVIAFSKVYDHAFNPVSNFAAVLTCSQADAGCPFIAGAEARIPVTYEDPKAFDGTPQQAAKYAERSTQIATELCYVFSNISKP